MSAILKTLAAGLLITLASCKDDTPEIVFPEGIRNVPINREINLDNPQFNHMQVPGTWAYLDNEGSRGLLITHDLNGTFHALERHCPYESRRECSQVSMDKSGQYSLCGSFPGVPSDTTFVPCCGTAYDMAGNYLSGPGTYPALIRYRTSMTGSRLLITN